MRKLATIFLLSYLGFGGLYAAVIGMYTLGVRFAESVALWQCIAQPLNATLKLRFSYNL